MNNDINKKLVFLENTKLMNHLKGFAMLGIMLYHWAQVFYSGVVGQVFHIGGQGVHIFFMLSAFGLYLSVMKKSQSNWVMWIKKRFSKMFVPYYISLGFAFFFIYCLWIISR